MQVRWKRLLLQSILWLSAEVILTSIGLDDLADYGEYHVICKLTTVAQQINSASAA
ncbi:MAG: hypothetical protein AAGG53_16935 [Cyanobacteria bacterium P01_H01_bin.152]